MRFSRIVFLLLALVGLAAAGPPPCAPDGRSELDGASSSGSPDESGASIRGTVTDASGAVLAGATISITNVSGFSQTVSTDSQGKYWVSGLPAGLCAISVTATGFKTFAVQNVSMVGGDVVPLDVVLERGTSASVPSASKAGKKGKPQAVLAKSERPASISGTVTNISGKAIPGAIVTITGSSGSRQTEAADAKGNYAAAELPPGTYDVSASAPGFKIFQARGVVLPSGGSIPLDATLESEKPSPTPSPNGNESATDASQAASEADTSAQAGAATPPHSQAHESANHASVTTSSGSASGAGSDVGTPGKNPYMESAANLSDALNVTPAIPAAPPGATAVAMAPDTPGQNQQSITANVVHDGTSATISGTVTDQTGAVLAGATVTVTNASGFKQTAISNGQGIYTVSGLATGTYDVSVSAANFKNFQAQGIAVVAGDTLPLDATLEPGGEKTEVNVEAGGAAQVATENAEVSGTITEKEVSTLGLNGRNFTQLITLTPGVSNQTGQDEAKVGVQGSVKYSVNGGRVEYNSFEVDGSDVLNAGLSGAESTLVVYPSLDAIQEVKVLTSNYGAQYGRTASGTVQVTTKSGGSQWHGNAYEYFRNEAFNARNYFDQTSQAPLYRRNDFGFTIGGPLWIPGHYNLNKDKTFVFFSEEFRYEKSPSELQSNFNHAVPTVAERQGNFSDVCPNPNDPQDLKNLVNQGAVGSYIFPVGTYPDCPGVPNGTTTPGYRLLFSNMLPNGNFLYNNLANPPNPNAGLDPNALAILKQNLIPAPNSFTGCNSSLVGKLDHTTGQLIEPCYDAVISEPTHWREELFRIDHNFNSRLRGTFRYVHDSWDTVTPTPNWGTVINTFPTVQNKFVGPGLDIVLRLTETMTPSLLNEMVFSYTDAHINLTNVNGPGGANYQRPAGLGDPSQVGKCENPPVGVAQCPMGYLFNNGFGGKAPGLVFTGNNQAYGGAGFAVDPSYMPWEHTNPTYNFRDDLSKAMARHTFHFGVQYVLAQKNETNGALGAASGDVQGLLTFSNVNGGALSTGNAFANFLYNDGNSSFLGGGNAIRSFAQDSAQLRYYNRYQIVEPYIQDDWRFSSRLTVNLGVRFSLFGPYHEKYLQAYNWDPNAFSQKLAAEVKVDPSTGQLIGLPGTRPIPFDLSNLDPRITNGIVRCGLNGVPSGCVHNHLFNPAPRLGFAWDPQGNGKTSIRAGYGIFYEHGTGDEANTGSLEASAPEVLNLTQPFPSGYACIGNYGMNCNQSGNGQPSLPGAFPINVTAIPTQTKYSYSQQWSLSVERELPKNLVATFAYVGSKGTHLTVERQLNQVKPISPILNPFAPNEPFLLAVPGSSQADCDNLGTITSPLFILQNGVTISPQNPASINMQIACQGQSTNSIAHAPIAVANVFRSYPGLGEIFELQNGADSSYHGFQTTIRRTKGPVTAGVAYSFSHSIDDSSDRTDPTFVNSLDLRSNKASSDFDQRHLLNISYVYSLPNLSHALLRWDNKQDLPASQGPARLARFLADGWQWAGITTYQTGTPFSVINNAGSSGIGVLDNAGVANGVGAGSYPDIAMSPTPVTLKVNPGSFGPLLGNPNEFVAPRGLTFGDAGRNFLNNPSRLNFDMSLLKHFAIREGSEVEFRAEAFNIFNHTQFRIYDPNLGNTGSNIISCYGGANYSAGAYFPGGADCLTGSSFLHPVDAHRARTMQLAIKYSF